MRHGSVKELNLKKQGGTAMKSRKATFIFFLFVMLVLGLAPQAPAQWGGYNRPDGTTTFDDWTNPQASGTKVYGTLTVHYQTVCSYSPTSGFCYDNCYSDGVHMYFAARLTKGRQLYSFAGSAGHYDTSGQWILDTVCLTDFSRQKDILFAFIEETVLPDISPGSTHFDLKGVDLEVDPYDVAPGVPLKDRYEMFDFTLAIQN
jgi:hypothetical protein